MAVRIVSILRTHHWLALENGEGYAYASPHRERAGYRWAVDVTIDLAPEARGKGAGRTLYNALLGILTMQGYTVAYAGITLPNAASVRLHEAMEFRRIGLYAGVGFKVGARTRLGNPSRFVS